jgi:hypothetical protein
VLDVIGFDVEGWMLATSRRRVNLNSERDDRAPGARLQDIREVETRVQ